MKRDDKEKENTLTNLKDNLKRTTNKYQESEKKYETMSVQLNKVEGAYEIKLQEIKNNVVYQQD